MPVAARCKCGPGGGGCTWGARGGAGPSVATLRLDGDVFFVIKAFMARVILATGMVHILPATFNTCPKVKFPYVGPDEDWYLG
jgi:hypothetical protein